MSRTTCAPRVWCAATILAAAAAATPLMAQDTQETLAIAGFASSARHCVSGDGANVHGIGWVDIGTAYTITFESEVTLATVITRLDLEAEDSTGVVGNPEFRATSSTAGTMALHVGAGGQGGCYRYKVELTPPAGAADASAPRAINPAAAAKLSKVAGPAAIMGVASSAKHCIAGHYVANVHDIGRVEQGNRITITFASDFDAIAGVTLENLVTQRGTYVVDDDGGGNLEPEINFVASHSSNLALFVSGFNGGAGCYRYKVELR